MIDMSDDGDVSNVRIGHVNRAGEIKGGDYGGVYAGVNPMLRLSNTPIRAVIEERWKIERDIPLDSRLAAVRMLGAWYWRIDSHTGSQRWKSLAATLADAGAQSPVGNAPRSDLAPRLPRGQKPGKNCADS